jgi:hypothetical protein
MAMASSSNPYEHYNQPHIEEDDDLIDPDDGRQLHPASRALLPTFSASSHD